MKINNDEYSIAIDDFLLRMESIPSETHPDTQLALDKLGQLLHIALAKLDFYDTPLEERKNNGNSHIMYRNGDPDMSRFFQQREMTGVGNVVIYTIYSQIGCDPWSDEELEKLRVLVKTIFVFHGRIRTMRLAEFLTFYDKELKIHNLTYFMKHTGQIITQGRIGDFAAAFFNLSNFSAVNQQLGRERGTEIMLSFIQQLAADFTEDEIVCRVGGDNFVTLFLKSHLDYVMNHFKGMEINLPDATRSKVVVSAAAGYYMIPADCKTSTDIMDCISAASNIARNLSKESFVFYDEQLKQRVTESKIIQDLFPEAIRKQEFQVYYQPKVDISKNRIIGSEALCRWFHDGTMIMPGRFIPILEQSKAICALDFYMLEHVCMDIQKWLKEGLPVVKVSVNLSRCHFGDMNLLQDILDIIDKYSVPHEYIEIELTETTTDVSFRDLKRIVYGLQKQGISTAIDDFGIGYSSLNLLRELPWDILKIDRSFLAEKPEAPEQNHVMLKHIIAMAQEMGIQCIVEGVESPDQVKLLKENNCYYVQGFLFDKPLTRDVYESRLSRLSK